MSTTTDTPTTQPAAPAERVAHAHVRDVALPGGLGTLEELAEILTWSQLGLQSKPCGLLDVEGFFDPLLAFLDHTVTERFVSPEHRALVLAADRPDALLDLLAGWRPAARDATRLDR